MVHWWCFTDTEWRVMLQMHESQKNERAIKISALRKYKKHRVLLVLYIFLSSLLYWSVHLKANFPLPIIHGMSSNVWWRGWTWCNVFFSFSILPATILISRWGPTKYLSTNLLTKGWWRFFNYLNGGIQQFPCRANHSMKGKWSFWLRPFLVWFFE